MTSGRNLRPRPSRPAGSGQAERAPAHEHSPTRRGGPSPHTPERRRQIRDKLRAPGQLQERVLDPQVTESLSVLEVFAVEETALTLDRGGYD